MALRPLGWTTDTLGSGGILCTAEYLAKDSSVKKGHKRNRKRQRKETEIKQTARE